MPCMRCSEFLGFVGAAQMGHAGGRCYAAAASHKALKGMHRTHVSYPLHGSSRGCTHFDSPCVQYYAFAHLQLHVHNAKLLSSHGWLKVAET